MSSKLNQVGSISILCLIKLTLSCIFISVVNSEKNDKSSTSILSYKVNTTVQSRFARTHVSINFSNDRNCTMLYGYEIKIPKNARVTNLTMKLMSNNECILTSEVKEEEKAQQQFDTSLSEGKPAAILKAWNSTLYPIQVSIPAYGKTAVDIVYEEILYKKKYEIKFGVPLFPGVPVDELIWDVLVDEPHGGVKDFNVSDINLSGLEIYSDDRNVASAHLELTNVFESNDSPRMIDVSYKPGFLPENGIIIPDRKKECITHLFNPESLLNVGPMPRNIIFVLDVSGSMQGQKIKDLKTAFTSIINTMTKKDYFTMHTFSNSGVESIWGPQKATFKNKAFATQFVQKLVASGSTNLHDAYIEGIKKVIDVQTNTIGSNKEDQYVPIMLILTDGQATTGITSSTEISKGVKKINESNVKIFALAFGSNADLGLLRGISLMNDGIAILIYEGFKDASMQMEDFFTGELGSIRLSDIIISFDIVQGSNVVAGNPYSVSTRTKSSFPILSDGSEIVVRARLDDSTINNVFSNKNKENSSRILQARTTGKTKKGNREWITQLDISNSNQQLTSTNSPLIYYADNECIHSFAHDKIKELLQFRDAVELLGPEQLIDYAPFNIAEEVDDLAAMAKSEALALALEAGLVWPGLTSIVTIDSGSCMDDFMGDNSSNAPQICPNDGVALDQDTTLRYENDAMYGASVKTKAKPALVQANAVAAYPLPPIVNAPLPPPLLSLPSSSPISAPTKIIQHQSVSIAPSSTFSNETLFNDTTRFLLLVNDFEDKQNVAPFSSTNENDEILQDATQDVIPHIEKTRSLNIRTNRKIEDGENKLLTTMTDADKSISQIAIVSCTFVITATLFFVISKLLN